MVGAEAEELDRVVDRGEARLGGDLLRPLFDDAALDLHAAAADPAGEVMVVHGGAALPVEDLSRRVPDRVDRALLAEDLKVAVDRGEPDGLAVAPELGVDLLRAAEARQAQALAAVLETLPGFCSAQEIHAELRRKGEQVGLATVYRHLQALSEQGSVDTIRDVNAETLYRQCGSSVHHHHLTCRNCGSSVEVEGRAVEQWAERVTSEAGFTDVGHTVELFGLCPRCAEAG